jgi:hypothetical protein
VFKNKCTGCLKITAYSVGDAVRDGLFRGSGVWVDFALLMRFDFDIPRNQVTFDGYYKATCDMYDAKRSDKFLTKSKFLDTWYEWNRARGLNYDAAFTCDSCPANPSERCVVADVTTFGIDRLQFVSADCAGCGTEDSKICGWYEPCTCGCVRHAMFLQCPIGPASAGERRTEGTDAALC